MRSTYRVLAGLIALSVVLQASFIAAGWFGVIKDLDDGAVLDKNYDGNLGHLMHSIFGQGVIPLLAIALLVISFFAKVPNGVRWALYVFGDVVLQFLLAFISFGVPAIGALHGINALVLFTLAVMTSRRATAVAPATAEAEAEVGPATEASR